VERQKRVAAIHDISGFGRCSLTVALPIISAAGIETCVIPTAVLSTHTGGFTGYTFRDFTDEILPIARHWRSLGIEFDAIYTGYVGSVRQLEILCEVFGMFRTEDNLIVVDPVMADHGQLYKSFTRDFPARMRKLAEQADIIVPNITEAVLLLEKPYMEGPYTREYIESLLKELSQIAPRVVLTGVHFDDLELGAAAYDADSAEISYAFSHRIDGFYHGTGDVFGSALVAALVKGFSLSDAMRMAVDFTVGSIERTKKAGTDVRYGVNFEEGLGKLAEQLCHNAPEKLNQKSSLAY